MKMYSLAKVNGVWELLSSDSDEHLYFEDIEEALAEISKKEGEE